MTGDPYAPPLPPTYSEIMVACETLLRAGYRDEVFAIMSLMFFTGNKARAMMTETRHG